METPVTSAASHPIPAHPGLPLLGNSLDFVRGPLNALQTYSRLYDQPDGPHIVRLSVGGRIQQLVFRPEDAKQVLQENHRNYGRSPAFQVLKLFLGEGLLTSDGDFWLRQRRLAQPAFHRRKLAILAETMIQEGHYWVDQLQARLTGKPVNISQSLMDTTMRIVCKTLFGADAEGQLNQDLSYSLEMVNYLANKLLIIPVRFPLWVPTPDNLKFKKATRLVNQLIYGFINKRRQTDERHDDLLDMLLNAKDEDTGEGMSDLQLRDECVTLFMAGHETTAVSMGWTLYLLSQHPEVLQKLHEEVDQVLDGTQPLTVDNLRALPYTGQIVQESMRLYPPAWIMSRLALQDDRIQGCTIPAGTSVLVSPYLLHRDPTLWPNPDRFDPDRFAPGRDKERHPFAYIPFGAGPRLCIGNQFALMEMQILLALFARRFTLKGPPAKPVGLQPLITLRPKQPIQLFVERR